MAVTLLESGEGTPLAFLYLNGFKKSLFVCAAVLLPLSLMALTSQRRNRCCQKVDSIGGKLQRAFCLRYRLLWRLVTKGGTQKGICATTVKNGRK